MTDLEEINMSDAEGRLTAGLVVDVFDALERHGYRAGSDADVGRAITDLARMVGNYEGDDQDG